jgi:4-amino-4-deoxy-L-arabinose transferase-like glycosyltransferase
MQYNSSFKQCFPLAILMGLCLLIILARTHTYNEPLERDLTTYAVIAHEMLNGRELYSELWDHKPPGVHLTYAAAEVVTGYGLNSIYLLNIIAAIITLFGVYFAGTALAGQRSAGLWAAISWAIISGNLGYQANQPNVEVFMNACLIWALFLFIKDDWSSGYRKAILIGLLVALASFYKQIAIVVPLLLGIVYIAIPPVTVKRRQALIHVIVMGSIGAVLWMVVFGYFAFMGRFEAFYDAVFVFNQAYADSLFDNLLKGLTLERLFPPFAQPIILPLGLLTLLGIVIGLLRKNRLWVYLLMYAIAVQIMVSLPGKFYPHYYQFWLPLLAVGAGAAVIELRKVIKWQWISHVVAMAVIVILLYYHLPLYKLSPDEWSSKKYGNLFVVSKNLGLEINKLLKPDETFYEWGAETGLYYYSQRSPATGVIFYYPLLHGPLAQKLSERVIADLERNKPELLILPPKVQGNHPVIAWLSSQSWLQIKTNVATYFSLYARRGGKLEARLLEQARSTQSK